MIWLAPAGRNPPFSGDAVLGARETNPTQDTVWQLQRVSLRSTNVSIARRLVFWKREGSWPVEMRFPIKDYCLLWRER